jgi:hypothetical protein
VTSITFDLVVDGIDEVHQVFTSVASAVAFFNDKEMDLGSLASGQTLGNNTLTIQAGLTISGASLGTSFYGHLITGEKSTASSHGAAQALTQSAAAFGASAAAQPATTVSSPSAREARFMAAPHFAAA